jgi:hypothetical protein
VCGNQQSHPPQGGVGDNRILALCHWGSLQTQVLVHQPIFLLKELEGQCHVPPVVVKDTVRGSPRGLLTKLEKLVYTVYFDKVLLMLTIVIYTSQYGYVYLGYATKGLTLLLQL